MLRRKPLCINCGVEGHVFRECTEPITSYGVIAFRRGMPGDMTGPMENQAPTFCFRHRQYESLHSRERLKRAELTVLLVQRRDTYAFIDFLRGRYDTPRELSTLLQEMTCAERERLVQHTFDQLWRGIWVNFHSKYFHQEYGAAKAKFSRHDLGALLSRVPCRRPLIDFWVPKGRRAIGEEIPACAKREFCEETGVAAEHVKILEDVPCHVEVYVGTNKKIYRGVYYFAHVSSGRPGLDHGNPHQVSEIQNLGWFTKEQAHARLGPDNAERARELDEIFEKVAICETLLASIQS
jgi:ADP-ribose pyrophosphatase YjhB (NUDIX family)